MSQKMASAARTIDDHAHDRARISPELVMVDPDLCARVRPRVPLLFRKRKPPLPVLHFAHPAASTEGGAGVDPRLGR